MKKLTSILLALMTMTTVSCASKNQSTAPESSIAETMSATQTAFYETRIPLEYTVERPIKLAMAGDDCYFFYISKRDIHCAVINGENQVVSDSVLGSVFNADMGVSPIVNEDGSYSVIYPVSDFPFEFNDYGEVTNYGDFIINGDFSFVLAKFDSTGNKLSETEIVGMRKTYEKTQSHLGNICPYSGGLLLCVGNGLILLDDEGNILDSAHFDQQSYDIGCDCEGNVIISGVFNCAMMDGSTLELPEILMDDPMELNSIEGAPSMGMGGYSYYLVYSDGIYGIDADGEGHLEFAFSPSFVDYMEVAKCYTARSCDEFFSAAVYSNEVLLYTRRPADYSSERIELDLWQINGGSSCEFVTAFNKLNDRYTVKVSGDRLCEEDLTKALLVDEGPDMILFSGNYVIDDLVNLGALADMNKLMDEYDGITRDELLPNVLRAYDKNGSIYALPDTFSISVMAANKEVIPRDMIDWTYDDLIEAFERQPEGTNLFNDVHESVFNALVSENLDVWMDWEKGVSRFNSPEFVRVLEFCKKNFDAKSKFDSDLDELELAEQKIRELKSLKEKTTMLEKMSAGCHGIWSLIADIGQCGIFLEDASLLKYPNGGGSGYIDYGNLISVMETCDCKEGAWAFVSYYLGEDYHSRHGFHGSNFTNKALFEKGLEATIAKDGNRRMEDYSYTYDNGKIKVDFSFPRTATAEEAAYYRDIVLSCDRLSFENLTLTGILCEEFDRYLHDEITAEECAEIIANRIDIYVSEKS